MEIKNPREWLIYMKGKVGTAVNRPATIGEVMEAVDLMLAQQEKE